MFASIINRTSVCLVLLLAFVCFSILLPTVNAADTSPWITNQPTVEADAALSAEDFVRLRANSTGLKKDSGCVDRKVQIRDTTNVNNKYKYGCWYNTKIGLISEDGLYVYTTGKFASRFFWSGHPNLQPKIFPTENPDVFVEFHYPDNANVSWRLRSGSSIALNIAITDKESWFTLPSAPSYTHQTEGGIAIADSGNTVQWSADNRYLVYTASRGGLIYRIDTKTFESVLIQATDHLNPSVAVSQDGRYIALLGASNLDIIDTNSCTKRQGSHNTLAENCKTVSYSQPLKDLVKSTELQGMQFVRFWDDHTVSFFHKSQRSSENIQYFLSALPSNYTTRYLALGDSFSSGEGAGRYLPGTDKAWRPDKNLCHTSMDSYPYLIKRSVYPEWFMSVACSGAKITNYWEDIQYIDDSNVYQKFHPGKNKKFVVVKENFPSTVTIGLAGNDIGFKDKLTECVLYSSECFPNLEARQEIAGEIKRQHPELVKTYTDILSKMGKNRRLYVIGYPQIASTDDSCDTNVRLSKNERIMANGLIEYLNAVIQSAANQAGAYYVDVETALNGYRLCEKKNGGLAVNGLTFGEDGKILPISNASFHPNAKGHRLLRDRILQKTANLTAPMPAKTSSPIPNPDDYSFLNMAPGGGLVRNIYNNSTSELPVYIRGFGRHLLMQRLSIPLAPFTTYRIYLHSEPVYLGDVTTDAAGFIDAEVTIPADTEPGLHSIHVKGLDVNGDPVDVYEYMYVAASADDFDGDGISDSNEPCGGLIQESGIDIDNDGIDDACDAEIGEPGSSPVTKNPADNDVPIIERSQEVLRSQFTQPTIQIPQGITSTTIAVNNPPGTALPHVLKSPTRQVNIQQPETSPQPETEKTHYSWLIGAGITLLFVLGYSVRKYAKQKD